MFTKVKIVLLCILAFSWSLVQGQPAVVAVSPATNSMNVSANTSIVVAFSQAMNPASINSTTWVVHGEQTGFYTGSISYDGASLTATFTPQLAFKPGEEVHSILSSGITNAAGQALAPAFQSSFIIGTVVGTGIFDMRLEVPLNTDPNNPVALDPVAVFAGDLDNDTFVDLAVANNTTNSVSILRSRFNTITGSFEVTGTVAVGNGPSAIAGGDYNNDGLLDLAVVNFDDNTISIVRNDGNRNFTVQQTIATAERPTDVGFCDYNNDGLLDIAVTALGVNRLQLFTNQGAGFNVSASNQATGASPYGFTSGDFDNDGDVDIVVTNSGDNSIIVYRNNGAGQLTNAGEVTVPDFPSIVRAGDLVGRDVNAYGDGVLDLAIIHPNINSVSVLENRSRDGAFVLSQQLDVGLRPSGLFVGNFDTLDATASSTGFGPDGDLDLAVPNIFSNNLYILRNQFNNNFTGDLLDVFDAGLSPVGIAGADFDRDGDIDIAITNLNSHSVSILLNKGGLTGNIRFTQPPGGIDFGPIYVGQDSTMSFSFINPTNAALGLDRISNTLPVFTLSDSQAVVAPNDVFTFSITFAPTDTLTYLDTLVVQSGIFFPSGQLRVAMRGQGVRAIIEVVPPDTLNFGGVVPPQVGNLPLQIFNRGNGNLNISQLLFSDPVFSAPTNSLTIGPYSNQVVNVTFQPPIARAYLDTLTITSNDSLNSPLTVVLLGGPNTAPPSFTSPDTVLAYEDSLFIYTATVNDPDGTQPAYIFQGLASWLALSDSTDPGNNSIQGIAREGYSDTTFRVIAVDGIFGDTLDVYVRVVLINDPPQFVPLPDQAGTELSILNFNVLATDPEDSTLIITAQNLPQGALFNDGGNGAAAFSWIPPANSQGTYPITFIVREAFGVNPLSDTMVVNVNIGPPLPDLVVADLSVPSPNIVVGQTYVLSAVVQANNASAVDAFRIQLRQDGLAIKDTTLSGLQIGQQVNYRQTIRFNRVSSSRFDFQVDIDNDILEGNEVNNARSLTLNAIQPALIVRPNPFTPNNDGYNDQVTFDFNQLSTGVPQLKIFTFKGRLLATLTNPAGTVYSWDGRDSSGRDLKPGMYLYVLSDRDVRLATGYFVLAR